VIGDFSGEVIAQILEREGEGSKGQMLCARRYHLGVNLCANYFFCSVSFFVFVGFSFRVVLCVAVCVVLVKLDAFLPLRAGAESFAP